MVSVTPLVGTAAGEATEGRGTANFGRTNGAGNKLGGGWEPAGECAEGMGRHIKDGLASEDGLDAFDC